MPPQKTVTGERTVQIIAELDKPFATTADLAQHFGVTEQTIRNNADRISSHDRIAKEMVAQSSVYWLQKPPKNDSVNSSEVKMWTEQELRNIAREEITEHVVAEAQR